MLMFRLRRFLKHYKLQLTIGPVCKLIEAIFELFIPLITADIIDTGVKNNTNAIRGEEAKNIKDIFISMDIAIITAPITRKGALMTSLMSMATANCNWLISLVILVIKEGVPILSSSAWENVLICLNMAFLTSVPNP